MEKLNCVEFTTYLKSIGCYIGEDFHLYRKNGKPLSRQSRNGYYTVVMTIEKIIHRFMEHRIIWCWHNGSIDDTLVINHLDFDRTNNNIDNLELVTQKKNVEYTKEQGRLNTPKGVDNPKALLNEADVNLIRYLRKNGWMQSEVMNLFPNISNENTISRVVTGARYGSVTDASDVISIYPTLVLKTLNGELTTEQRITNACIGMGAEIGEVNDLIKKWLYQGAELDLNDVIRELGDVVYYLTWLCLEFDIDFSEIMYQNMVKLEERYPNGFNYKDANERNTTNL